MPLVWKAFLDFHGKNIDFGAWRASETPSVPFLLYVFGLVRTRVVERKGGLLTPTIRYWLSST